MYVFKQVTLVIMALLYIAAGVYHFVNPEFYVKIMPPYLPQPLLLVYLSGVAEILLGVLLFPRKTRALAAWGIVAMLIAFYPVHIHMLLNPEDFGMSSTALWVRMAIQVVLILWAWWYTRDAKPVAQ